MRYGSRLAEDKDFFTSGTFLTAEQFRELDFLPNREARIEYVKKCIKENQKELISWMRNLRLYYETDTQIFVHAGVDEDIPEEEIQWCTLGTPDYVMTGKYPPSIGHFYKDIIAGHVAASHLARDFRFSMMGKVIIILMGQLLSLEEYYAWHTMRSQKNIISWKKMDASKKYVEKESKKSK